MECVNPQVILKKNNVFLEQLIFYQNFRKRVFIFVPALGAHDIILLFYRTNTDIAQH